MEIPGRNSTIDFIRGVTAISICLFHFAYGTLSITDGNVLSAALVWTPFRWHVFFLLSGFVIPTLMDKKRYTINQAGRFLARRFIRVGPAAYVAMVLMIGLQLGCIALKGRPIDGIAFPGFGANAVAGNLLFHVGLFHTTWYYTILGTLQIELEFYILIALCFGFLIKSKMHAIAFILLLLITSVVGEVTGIAIHFPFLDSHPYFVVGILLFLFYSKRISYGEAIALFAFAVSICFYLNGFVKALSCALVFFLVISTSSFRFKPIDYLGKISYSIYLTHIVVAVAIDGLYKLFFPVPSSMWVKTVFLVLIIAVVLAAAALFYRLIERPLSELSRKINY